MSDVPFYTILDPVRWSRAEGEVHGALGRRGKARNAKCLCGSGRKFKVCCGNALAGPPEDWLDENGGLRLVPEDGLSPELLQDIGHMARIQKTRIAFRKSGSIESIPANAASTDWAAVASVLRVAEDDQTEPTGTGENPPEPNGAEENQIETTGADENAPESAGKARVQLQDALRRILALPLDLCLDYRRIVFDLVELSIRRGDFFAAVEAQQWWIDFLDDFGKAFGLRVEAVRRLHELRVLAGQAEPTEEACQALIRSYIPESPSRAALIKKSGA